MIAIKSAENVIYYTENTEKGWYLDKILVDGAWEITNGSSNIVVAVIDTGVDFTHSELTHAKWINTGETADNAIDDDGNGYVDDTHGWDFTTVDGHVPDNEPGPEVDDGIHWHGTAVSGIIAALGNGEGLVGIAQNVKIMDCRVALPGAEPYLTNPPTIGTTNAELGDAIRYAVDNGADILCISLGFWTNTTDWYDDIVYAYNNDVPIVSVTGNTWGGGEEVMKFPGCFDEVISVGASTKFDTKADYSNYGPWTELVAPVGDQGDFPNNIKVLYLDNSYEYVFGTTFACAQVVGAIALMKSVNDSLTIDDIRDILHYTATDLGDVGRDDYFGYGLLNVEGAVIESQERGSYEFPTPTSSTSPDPTEVSPGLTFIIGSLSLSVMVILIGFPKRNNNKRK